MLQFTGTQRAKYVGRFSPLWSGPNLRLQEKWEASQKRGAETHKFARFMGLAGFANTMNGFISGALYSLMADRRFLFNSPFNHLFNATEGGWDWAAAALTDKDKAPRIHVDLINDQCFEENAQWSKNLSTQDGFQPADWAAATLVTVVTNCPLQKYWGKNPSLQAKLLDLGLITQNSDLPQGFQIAHQLV